MSKQLLISGNTNSINSFQKNKSSLLLLMFAVGMQRKYLAVAFVLLKIKKSTNEKYFEKEK